MIRSHKFVYSLVNRQALMVVVFKSCSELFGFG